MRPGVSCCLREEVSGGHVERQGEAVDDVQRRVPSAALNARDVSAVETSVMGEILLRPTMPGPELAHAGAERSSVGWNGHPSTLALR